MKNKLYKYTLLKQDGTEVDLGTSKKKTFQDFYRILFCNTIQIIPADYYKNKKWGHVTVYGDEEARYNLNNKRNPHFEVLKDAIYHDEWDIVGDCIKEEVAK